MREARVHTGWAFPNAEYEDATMSLIDAALTGSRAGAFLAAFLPFARRLAAAGAHNSLVQTVLKLTAPGVPDLYNGSELWDLSMVDPDNRHEVDYALRRRMLDAARERAGERPSRLHARAVAGLVRRPNQARDDCDAAAPPPQLRASSMPRETISRCRRSVRGPTSCVPTHARATRRS